MKKQQKKELKDYSNYIEKGNIEVAKDNNINVDITTIINDRKGTMPDSVFILQRFSQKLAYRNDYTLTTHRVLHYFISITEFENHISVDVKTISEDLNISLPSVKRATKQLYNDNIILKIVHPTDKRRLDYFINPMAMWKGKTMNRDKFLNKAKKESKQLKLFGE